MSKYFIRGDSEDISWGVWPTNHVGMTDLGYGRGRSKSNISPFQPAELVYGGQQASKIYFLASQAEWPKRPIPVGHMGPEDLRT
jgi:hypothetical protein